VADYFLLIFLLYSLTAHARYFWRKLRVRWLPSHDYTFTTLRISPTASQDRITPEHSTPLPDSYAFHIINALWAPAHGQHVAQSTRRRRSLAILFALLAGSPPVRHPPHCAPRKPISCFASDCSAFLPCSDLPQHVHQLNERAQWREGR
jgi:hypothetical protein